MATIADYLQTLVNLKGRLKDNLIAKGVEVTDGEKLNSLVDRVADISASEPIDKVLYSIGVLSDIHLKDVNHGYADEDKIDDKFSLSDYQKALTFYKDNGVDFVAIAGDVVANNWRDDSYYPAEELETVKSQERSEWVAELQLYKQYNETYFPDKSVYTCTGNHDACPLGHWESPVVGLGMTIPEYGDGTKTGEQVWEEIVGTPLNHVVEHNGDVFIFFSMYYWNYVTPCRNEDIDWLEEKLEQYKEQRVFLFWHLPIPDTFAFGHGLEFLANDASCRAGDVRLLLESYPNTICFTGHSHYDLALEAEYDNANTYRADGTMTMIHCSSTAYPRLPNGDSYSNVPTGSQGYLVDVYENKVVIKGVDFTIGESGAFIPSANYVINV